MSPVRLPRLLVLMFTVLFALGIQGAGYTDFFGSQVCSCCDEDDAPESADDCCEIDGGACCSVGNCAAADLAMPPAEVADDEPVLAAFLAHPQAELPWPRNNDPPPTRPPIG